MTFFKDNTLADVHDFLDVIATQLTSEGWSRFTPNASTDLAFTDHKLGREEVFKSNGQTGGHPGGHYIDFLIGNPTTLVETLRWCGWTGQKGPFEIDTIAQSGTTVTITTVLDHGFATGDLVCHNGSSDPLLNFALNMGTGCLMSAVATITVTGAKTFTYTAQFSQTVSSSGGYCWAIYNPVGSRSDTSNYFTGAVGINIASPMTVFGYVDELRICGLIAQGSQRRAFYLGLTARTEHVQEDGNAIAVLTAPVVGDGVNPQTFSLDRTVSNLYATQRIDVLAPNSALPESAGYKWRSDLEVMQIATFSGPANSFTAIPSAHTYPAGSLVGWDPMPLLCLGSTSGANQDLGGSSYLAWLPWGIDGVRPSTLSNLANGSLHILTPKAGTEARVDPDAQGNYHLAELLAEGVSGTSMTEWSVGAMGPLVGLYACPTSISIQDQNLVRTGDPATDPDTVFMYFDVPIVASVFGSSVGPKAVS